VLSCPAKKRTLQFDQVVGSLPLQNSEEKEGKEREVCVCVREKREREKRREEKRREEKRREERL
jgi:hypothetical protein